MKQFIYKNDYSIIQKLFIERMIELTDGYSLDSYRVRTINFYSAMEEMYKVISDYKKYKIQSFETVLACKTEILTLIDNEECFNYNNLSKELFKDLLSNLKDDKDKDNKDNMNKIENYIYSLLGSNSKIDYLENLATKIKNILLEEDMQIEANFITKSIKLDGLTNSFIGQIINVGFSKIYIYKLVQALFVYKPVSDNFSEIYTNFLDILKNFKYNDFVVIFRIESDGTDMSDIQAKEVSNEVNLSSYNISSISSKLTSFININSSRRFVVVKSQAIDFHQAIKNAKNQLAFILDTINIGHSEINIFLHHTALVINLNNPDKAAIQSLFSKLDGVYASNPQVYQHFFDNIAKIQNNLYIDNTVKEKIKSALRYLRLGNEVIGIEQKFINYWIGLEYIFSDYDVNSHTFARIKKYFPIIHTISYVKRNLQHFHNSIKLAGLNSEIPNFDANLKYLKEASAFDIISQHKNIHSLLAYRANRFKSKITNNTEKRKEYLEQHRKNLETHFVRMYRLRNELIHEAAISLNIENITSNLRYYLTFLLSKQIEYFISCNAKINQNDKVTMNDFFISQELILENIIKSGYNIDLLLSISYPQDFLN